MIASHLNQIDFEAYTSRNVKKRYIKISVGDSWIVHKEKYTEDLMGHDSVMHPVVIYEVFHRRSFQIHMHTHVTNFIVVNVSVWLCFSFIFRMYTAVSLIGDWAPICTLIICGRPFTSISAPLPLQLKVFYIRSDDRKGWYPKKIPVCPLVRGSRWQD